MCSFYQERDKAMKVYKAKPDLLPQTALFWRRKMMQLKLALHLVVLWHNNKKSSRLRSSMLCMRLMHKGSRPRSGGMKTIFIETSLCIISVVILKACEVFQLSRSERKSRSLMWLVCMRRPKYLCNPSSRPQKMKRTFYMMTRLACYI